MPAQKSAKPVSSAKPAAKAAAKPAKKATAVPASKTKAAEPEEVVAKKKPGRPPKAAAAESSAPAKTGAKRGRKPKAAAAASGGDADDLDMSDIEADLVGEPEAAAATPGEKVKPLRMKISKAKERALMKEFGLDETVLSEEDMAKRRARLKALITLGKTRGYLTHGEISDHLPDKLVDAETLEVVISMLNDMGVAVYEQTPVA